MAKVSDYALADIVAFFDLVWWRMKMKDGSTPAEFSLLVSVEESRMIFAAQKYLEVYYLRNVGVEDLPNSVPRCERMLKDKIAEMKLHPADDRRFNLAGQDILIFRDIIKHLDRYLISLDFREKSASSQKWKKKK